MARGGQEFGIFVVRKKRLHLPIALGPEDRASAVQQAATWS